MRGDPALALAVLGAAQDAAGDGRADGPGDADDEPEVLLGGAVGVLEALRRGADAERPGLEREALVGRALAQIREVGLVHGLIDIEVGHQQDIGLELGGIVNEPGGLPAEGTHREVVEPEGDLASLGCGGRAGCGRGERGAGGGREEVASGEGGVVHGARLDGFRAGASAGGGDQCTSRVVMA